jgi:hypothetical protein
MNSGPWSVVCRDFVGRERSLHVVVRGAEVVFVSPPGETAVLDHTAIAQLHSAVVQAAQMANAPAPGAPGRAPATGTASTAEQYNGGRPPATEGRPALPPYRGGTTTPIPGPAAIPATVVGARG